MARDLQETEINTVEVGAQHRKGNDNEFIQSNY